jgi:hypothetical protein
MAKEASLLAHSVLYSVNRKRRSYLLFLEQLYSYFGFLNFMYPSGVVRQ